MIRLDPVSYLSNVKHKDVAQLFSEQKEVPALLGMIIYLQMRDSSIGSVFCNPPPAMGPLLFLVLLRVYYAIINNRWRRCDMNLMKNDRRRLVLSLMPLGMIALYVYDELSRIAAVSSSSL